MSSATPCLHRLRISTPLGELLALASDEGLCALEFPRRDGPAFHERLQRRLERWFPPHEIVDRETRVLARTREWLSAYFDGASADVPAADELRRAVVQRPEGLLTVDPGLATAPPEQLTLSSSEDASASPDSGPDRTRPESSAPKAESPACRTRG